MLPNYPAFYELFSSRAYFTVKGAGYVGMSNNPDPSGACPDCLSYAQTYTTATASMLNTTIWPPSEQFHEALDGQNDWQGIPVDVVVGTGQSTVVGMRAQGALRVAAGRHADALRARGEALGRRDGRTLQHQHGESVHRRQRARHSHVRDLPG
jgi:hypothetical protein